MPCKYFVQCNTVELALWILIERTYPDVSDSWTELEEYLLFAFGKMTRAQIKEER